MGLSDLFGAGKKEKTPFRIPKEISELRTRIDAETRENFPSLARYNELKLAAEAVAVQLDEVISKGIHSEDAAKIKDDIRKRMSALTSKIQKNVLAAKKENKQDYVESNIDYLERKSTRDKAKTLFTNFLDLGEAFRKFCYEGRLESGTKIETLIAEYFNTIVGLNSSFFKPYGKDKEISMLQGEVLKKVSELYTVFKNNETRFHEKALEAYVESKFHQTLNTVKETAQSEVNRTEDML